MAQTTAEQTKAAQDQAKKDNDALKAHLAAFTAAEGTMQHRVTAAVKALPQGEQLTAVLTLLLNGTALPNLDEEPPSPNADTAGSTQSYVGKDNE